MEIKVYVCPTPGCGHYYGSSGTDHSKMQQVLGQKNGNFEPNPPEQWFKKIECPDCRVRDVKVDRIPFVFESDALSRIIADPVSAFPPQQ